MESIVKYHNHESGAVMPVMAAGLSCIILILMLAYPTCENLRARMVGVGMIGEVGVNVRLKCGALMFHAAGQECIQKYVDSVSKFGVASGLKTEARIIFFKSTPFCQAHAQAQTKGVDYSKSIDCHALTLAHGAVNWDTIKAGLDGVFVVEIWITPRSSIGIGSVSVISESLIV
jgi:hypothetical protein